jgi:thiamine kinase-like enzyme
MAPSKYIQFLFLSFALFSSSLFAQGENLEKIVRVSANLPEWNRNKASFYEVSGGLTNVNYKVCIGPNAYFVRCSCSRNQLLGSSLETEWKCSSIAAMAGVSPQPLFYVPDEGILISEFIETDGRNVDLRDPLTQKKFCVIIRSLHQLDAKFPTEFSPFTSIHSFAENALSAGAHLPEAIFDTLIPLISQLKSRVGPVKTVPCHLDLHHGNILDDGKKLWLIDWEYSAMGDPYFDLATLASIENFSDSEMVQLLKSYCDECGPTQEEIAHLYSMRILADARWSLWCYLQAKISPLGPVFIPYGDMYLQQCLERLKTLF